MKLCALQIALLLSGACAARADDLPLNPDVTQAVVERTICVIGWTKRIRPSSRETSRIKMQMLRAEGLPDEAVVDVQLDHRIPIVLGGAPLDRRNFQLQDWEEASLKDATESCLARAVCAGKIELDEARRRIWKDWRHVGVNCDGG